jgi:hypothetical protein
MTNIIIPTDIIKQIPYSSGQIINNNIVFNVNIVMNLNEDGTLPIPIQLKIIATFNDNTTQTLQYSTNYTVTPILNGLQITLLQNLVNCDYITFIRETTANYNSDYTVLLNIKNQLNVDFNTTYSAIQELQSYKVTHEFEINNLLNDINAKADITYVDNNFVNIIILSKRNQIGAGKFIE